MSIIIVTNLELYEHSNYLKLTYLNQKKLLLHNKKKKCDRVEKAEVSFFCNCYHLGQCNMNEKRSNNL